METMKTDPRLAEQVQEFVLTGFSPRFGQLSQEFPSLPLWRRLRELGSQLWLDTGDIDDARQVWTREFSALTTNNTLLNMQVQKGLYDELIVRADAMLRPHSLSESHRMLEIAFILNAYHALRLVEGFDAFVSVEEHTAMANDLEATVDCARRYHAICPERFIVKIPLTPAGVLAARRLGAEGIPVNHTLGFSARQNYVMARVARPQFVNVFLSRLNNFIDDNALGDGTYAGERATLAAQAAVRRLRRTRGLPTRQIGASFRKGQQARDLAGMDVMTIPPSVAHELLDMHLRPLDLQDCSGKDYYPSLKDEVDPKAIRLDSLWDIDETLIACLDALDNEHIETFTARDLVGFFASHGCADLFVNWTTEQVDLSYREGKIPSLANWRDALASGQVGLDAVFNLAGLNSFAADQKAMDDRVAGVLAQ